MTKPRILVIDDDRLTRELLVRALEREGFEAHSASDAREALQLVEQERPALIVSDYEMPELNGAALCELIRKHPAPETADLPIILLTAHGGEEHELECLAAGANDFVSKPVNGAVLKARIETHLRLHALRAQLQQQNVELEEWRRNHELDLEAAQITQQAILPVRPPKIPGWEVAGCFQPVIQVGGDMYDWFRLPEGRWLIWIADATGHGASAALLTTLTKLVFRHASGEYSAALSPAILLKEANKEFHSVLRGKSFMTAACLIVEPNSGTLRFAGAGHPPLLIFRASGKCEFLPSQGPPMGILPELETTEQTADLDPGDLVLLYTDGLYSLADADGARLGPSDLPPMLPKISAPEVFLAELLQSLRARVDGPLPDDLAAVALRRVS
jgi:sigma-B regulation protein RsbU (phosphoserine phosphatase)